MSSNIINNVETLYKWQNNVQNDSEKKMKIIEKKALEYIINNIDEAIMNKEHICKLKYDIFGKLIIDKLIDENKKKKIRQILQNNQDGDQSVTTTTEKSKKIKQITSIFETKNDNNTQTTNLPPKIDTKSKPNSFINSSIKYFNNQIIIKQNAIISDLMSKSNEKQNAIIL